MIDFLKTDLKLLGLLFLLCTGCTNSGSLSEQYRKQLVNPDNGLRIQLQSDYFTYELRYLPPVQQVVAQHKNDRKLTKASLKDELKNYEDHLYFSLKLQARQTNDFKSGVEKRFGKGQTEDILNQLYFQLQDNFTIKYQGKEFPCVLYHASPPLFAGSGLELMLVFNTPGLPQNAFEDQLELSFDDDVLSKQMLSFTCSQKSMNQIASLER